jgi:hypothetical protein
MTGRKVILNRKAIWERCGTFSTAFTKFLDENEGRVFTARIGIQNVYFTMYELDEDPSEDKWLFQAEDLIFLDEEH